MSVKIDKSGVTITCDRCRSMVIFGSACAYPTVRNQRWRARRQALSFAHRGAGVVLDLCATCHQESRTTYTMQVADTRIMHTVEA